MTACRAGKPQSNYSKAAVSKKKHAQNKLKEMERTGLPIPLAPPVTMAERPGRSSMVLGREGRGGEGRRNICRFGLPKKCELI